jgi:hypothetical protein
LEQEGSCDFDSFTTETTAGLRARIGSKAKTLGNKQEWSALNRSQQFEILHNVAKEHTRVTLNFESLNRAIKAAQTSNIMTKAMALDDRGGDAAEESDPDEKAYIKELLEEKSERAVNILEAEDLRLDAELQLLIAKSDLAKEFSISRELYAALLDCTPETNVTPAVVRHKSRTKSDNALEQKKEALKAEEDRVNQMRLVADIVMGLKIYQKMNNFLLFYQIIQIIFY